MARPYKSDPEAFCRSVDRYIQQCLNNDEIPTDYGLSQYINVHPSTIDNYRDYAARSTDPNNGYKRGFSALKKYTEHAYVRDLRTSKNPAGAIFALKQAKHGGWVDRQEVNTNGTLTIKTGGISEDAFK